MQLSSSPRLWCLLLLLWCTPSLADTVLSLRSAHWPGGAAQGLQARLGNHDAHQLSLAMQISQLSIDRLGWHKVGLQVNGLVASEPGGRWRFQGQVACHGAPGGAWSHARLDLLVDTLANTLLANLLQDQSRLSAALPLDQPSHWQISLYELPAAWLHPGVEDGRESLFTKGLLSGELAVDLYDDGLHESGNFHGQNISLNLPGIGFSGSSLEGTAQLNARLDAHGHLLQARLQAELQSGRWSFQRWQANLGSGSALHLGLQADAAEHGEMGVALHWDDPNALRFDGQLQLDARGRVRELNIDHFGLGLALAYQHYGASFDGLPWVSQPLAVSGQVSGSLAWRSTGWRLLALRLRDVNLQAANAALTVQGLQGGLDWRQRGTAPTASLEWRQLSLGDLAQPAGALQWQSRDGQLRLLTPWHLNVWGGQLVVNSLLLAPQPGGLQWTAVASLQNLHLDAPMRALGLPAVPLIWTQAGIPMHGSHSQWIFDSVLQGGLWGGRIAASGVHLQWPGPRHQPLSVVADLKFEQIDLQAFSSFADLGNVSGSVHGRVDGLYLQQGLGPQAFQLTLRSQSGGRLSQRAVSVLAALTGSNASSGLQGMMLHIFHSPAYNRLGLDAQLADGNLFLDGLTHDSHGYTVVEGRGLPYLRLIGRDAQIPWDLAGRRVHAAMAGHPPAH